jgi:hypothetical protein
LSNIEGRIITASLAVTAKTDYVPIGEAIGCSIERIYKIGDDEDTAMIKDQLLSKPKTYFPPKKRKNI